MKMLQTLLFGVLAVSLADAAELPGDKLLADYFRQETARLAARNLAEIKTLEDWTAKREGYRRELEEMLGLSPMPPKTDLKATITGRKDHEQFFVENLHYQSMPGLYVTANLYVPKNLTKKVPAILYVCGHSLVKTNGVSFGNKTGYQHHGEWFARNGYVCLVIDTIQLGELEGIHHGTYREGMWWWNSRGYTPAGVEAWNSMRGLDYLQSRPEVDGDKLGITGRSGGGGYSWYTAALDERIKVAVPVAGMTDLQNQVVDGCVEGHCDCMFMLNTYRWDFAKVAALIAPRPLLIGNSDKDKIFPLDGSDKDKIFPLDGVVRLHNEVARIYGLYGATNHLGLLITEGPHKDTQDLQVPAFRWFNRQLKGEDPLIGMAAEKLFTPQELKVFSSLPADQRTTKIHETFVPVAKPAVPADKAMWQAQREGWLRALKEKSFRGWPDKAPENELKQKSATLEASTQLMQWSFTSQEGIELPLYAVAKGNFQSARAVKLYVMDEKGWTNVLAALTSYFPHEFHAEGQLYPGLKADGLGWMKVVADVENNQTAVVFLPPRGIGLTAWNREVRAQGQIRRRFMLLGQTLDGMRVWDIKRAVEVLRGKFTDRTVQLAGEREEAVNALYATLFVDGVSSLELIEPSATHQSGPDYLNVLRFMDVPQALAMAVEKIPVKITRGKADQWAWTTEAIAKLGWPAGRLEISDPRKAALDALKKDLE
jgi:hypothetical protein